MATTLSNSIGKMLRLFKSLSHEEAKAIQASLRHFSKDAKPPRQVPREKPAVKRGSGRGGYPLLIIPLTCVGLGTWQIQRRQWKLNLIKELEDRMNTPPAELPQDFKELSDKEYYRFKARGTFDHSKELFIGPRSAVDEGSALHKTPAVGVHVVTPFKLSDRDETILVNRGHVTYQQQPPTLRKDGQIEGEVEIVGVYRRSDKASIIKQDPLEVGYWMNRNVEEMAQIAETAPVFLDADESSTVPGGPKGGQTRVSLRNEHLSYIITWYALAALTFYLWFKNYKSAKPHPAVINYLKKTHKRL